MVGLVGRDEPSATTVHKGLGEAGLSGKFLLWNAFPLHPHKPNDPHSNRKPNAAELQAGPDLLQMVIEGRRVLCVGQVARKQVAKVLGREIPDLQNADSHSRAIVVWHPSYGGSRQFTSESKEAFKKGQIT